MADIYPREQRGKFQGLFGSVFALSSVVGPVVGGFIVQFWYWGWIFYINLILGIPALIIMTYSFTDIGHRKSTSIDWLGIMTFIAAIVALLAAVELPNSSALNWNSIIVHGLITFGCLSLAAFVWVETKATEPLIPLHLFKNNTVTFGNIAGFMISAAMFDVTTYVPLFVQEVIGYTPSHVSLMVMPLMLAVVVSMNVGGRFMRSVSYRAILIPSMSLMAIGFVLLTMMKADTTLLHVFLAMVITGLGMGAIYPAIGTAVQSAVSGHQIGVATSSSQFFRSIGGAIGVSVFGGIVASKTLSTIVGGNAERIKLMLHDFHFVFALGLGCVLVAVVASMLLGNDRLIRKTS